MAHGGGSAPHMLVRLVLCTVAHALVAAELRHEGAAPRSDAAAAGVAPLAQQGPC